MPTEASQSVVTSNSDNTDCILLVLSMMESEILHRNYEDDSNLILIKFQKQLESLLLPTDRTIGIHLGQIIKNRRHILNNIRKKHESFFRESVEPAETPTNDSSERANDSGLESNVLDSERSEPLLSEIIATDPESERFADEVPSILLECFFVEDDERFRCGIMQCGVKMQQDNFLAHLRTHELNYPFICVHCKLNVGYDRENAVHHMYLHYQYLYYCVTCKYARSSRFLMVLHFVKKHLNVESKFWFKDQIRNKSTLVKLSFVCNECKIVICIPKDLAGHFYNYHESQMVDFVITAALNAFTSKYFVQNQLNCIRCHTSYGTKSAFIEHHRDQHPTDELNIKLSDLELLPIKRIPSKQIQLYAQHNSRIDRNIFFRCIDCNDGGTNLFSDVREIYDHWGLEHRSNDFQFVIGHLIECHYCGFISNFHEMRSHQKNVHAQRPLAIASLSNPEKCGICNRKVDAIAEHCRKEHEMLKHSKLFDPVHMNDELLHELSTFNCAENEGNAIRYSISGCCYESIPANTSLLTHILCHLEPIDCRSCSFRSSDGFRFAKHDCARTTSDISTKFRRNLYDIFFDTRVVFKNGLIVTRANLIGTSYDRTLAFDDFIDEMLNIHYAGAN